MTVSGDSECTCTDCGVKITGVPVVPLAKEGPTQAQIEKLKPTVYLCSECAKERGLSFDAVAVGKKQGDLAPNA
jgi:DNA-directed RNA polymerase subunit RPC12/RpoP